MLSIGSCLVPGPGFLSIHPQKVFIMHLHIDGKCLEHISSAAWQTPAACCLECLDCLDCPAGIDLTSKRGADNSPSAKAATQTLRCCFIAGT